MYYKTKDGEEFNNEQQGQDHANGLGYGENGNKAYKEGNYDEAISYFDMAIPLLSGRQAGTYGRSKGLAYLYRGDCYFNKKNYDKAIEDCNSALIYRIGISSKGEANAYNIRGAAYKGKGEYEKAKADFKKAADLGDKYAKENLADCETGALVDQGVTAYQKQDYAKAVELWKKAADMGGDENAFNNLGICYRDGLGVKQDFAKAEDLLKKAINGGHTGAQGSLDKLKQMRGK